MPRGAKTLPEGHPGRPLQAFLFDELIQDLAGGTLFRSPADVGEYVVDHLKIPNFTNAHSLGNYLSSVLGGKRPCAKRLRVALRRAVKERLAERGIAAERGHYLMDLDRLIDAINNTEDRRATDSTSDRRRHPSKHEESLTICPFFSLARHSTTGRQYVNSLCAQVKLGESGPPPAVRYTFCVQSREEAIDVWASLPEAMLRNRTVANQAQGKGQLARSETLAELERLLDRLAQLEAAGCLRVILLPYYLCLAPATIYRFATGELRAMYLHYGETDMEKFTEVRPLHLPLWERFYSELASEMLPGMELIPFREQRAAVAASIVNRLAPDPASSLLSP